MIRREKVNKKVDGQRSKSKGTILERIGFKEKEQEFWDYVGQFEIVGLLVETWVEERSWGGYKSRYRTSISGNAKGQNEKRKKEELQGE
jgi:hypothetical protein